MIDDTTAGMMQDCKRHITALDAEIGEQAEALRQLKKAREKAVSKLRDLVRGEQALPFGDTDKEAQR